MIKNKINGFTVVELTVVIIIISVLSAIMLASYNGIQFRAQQSRIKADLDTLQSAIQSARAQSGNVLGVITGNWYTDGSCGGLANGTDLSTLPKSHTCWVNYLHALDAISIAGGVNVRNLVDPWGRPYAINENEHEFIADWCQKDDIAMFNNPYQGANLMSVDGTWREIPNFSIECRTH